MEGEVLVVLLLEKDVATLFLSHLEHAWEMTHSQGGSGLNFSEQVCQKLFVACFQALIHVLWEGWGFDGIHLKGHFPGKTGEDFKELWDDKAGKRIITQIAGGN